MGPRITPSAVMTTRHLESSILPPQTPKAHLAHLENHQGRLSKSRASCRPRPARTPAHPEHRLTELCAGNSRVPLNISRAPLNISRQSNASRRCRFPVTAAPRDPKHQRPPLTHPTPPPRSEPVRDSRTRAARAPASPSRHGPSRVRPRQVKPPTHTRDDRHATRKHHSLHKSISPPPHSPPRTPPPRHLHNTSLYSCASHMTPHMTPPVRCVT